MNWFDGEETKEKKAFDKLPAGIYHGKITNIKLDETRKDKAGNPYSLFTVEFTLESKRKVWMDLRMTEASKKFFNWQMRELEVYDTAKSLVEKGKSPVDAFFSVLNDTIGSEADVEVTYSEGYEKPNVRVESFFGAVKSGGGSSVASTPKVSPPAGAPPKAKSNDTEEIPF